MTKSARFTTWINLGLAFLSSSSVCLAEAPPTKLYELVERLIAEGSVAGAQVAVGTGDQPLVAKSFGVVSVESRRPVNHETRFCIGSCSKMFAAAVVVSLASQGELDLDQPIDRWFKDFQAPRLGDGENASRAPTLRELLCHRAGIYSQRNEMTPAQVRWIRDFKTPLSESAAGIAREPLSSEPGTEYAYSGAGYCVLGRVAEVATNRSFDELLGKTGGGPIASHTHDILSAPPMTPTLPSDTRLAMASSLFRNARLTYSVTSSSWHSSAAASMHRLRRPASLLECSCSKANRSSRPCLPIDAWRELTKVHSPRDNGGYGLGIYVVIDEKTRQPRFLAHSGSLFGSFAHMAINLESKRYGVVTFTGTQSRDLNAALQAWTRNQP